MNHPQTWQDEIFEKVEDFMNHFRVVDEKRFRETRLECLILKHLKAKTLRLQEIDLAFFHYHYSCSVFDQDLHLEVGNFEWLLSAESKGKSDFPF